MTNLDLFKYEDHDVRAVVIDGEPWFVATDVCDVLEVRNSRDALGRLDNDERGVATTDTLGGPQQVSVISESGLYSLTMTSRKPEARAFRRWITHDVLPAIRATGSYGSPVGMSFEEMTAHVIGELTQRIDAAQAKARELESPARAWNALSSAEGDFTISDTAKILGRDGKCPGPRQMFGWLEGNGWIFRRGGRWQAMQTAVNGGFLVERITSGYFDQVTGERKQGKPEVRVTAKGLERLRELLATERDLVLIEGDLA